MKATLVNTFFYFLFVESISAQKDRIYLDEGGTRQNPQHFESPSEEDGDEKNIFLGRSEIPQCGQGSGGSRHHDSPCDENVDSKGVDNSDSISTRYDPVTKAPSETKENPTEGCVSSEGTFGTISDIAIPITYLYEMQTVDGTDEEKVVSKILPKLEKVIVDSILHDVFPEKCATTAIGKRNLIRSLNGRLVELVGLSMYPPDEITTNSCKVLPSSESTSECFVLKGELTVYLDEDQLVDEDQISYEQEIIGDLIQENMDSGVYNDAREEIVKLHYFEKLDPTESNISDGRDGDGQVKNRNNKSLRMGLFVGIGALAAVLAGVAFRLTRRMRNKDDQTEMQTGVQQTYLDVEEQRSSFS